ncbi:MAG: hypothetical protein PWR04_1368 [Anaerophaga sp.]|nr:hypothetical protein [Anaerophaga sp.]
MPYKKTNLKIALLTDGIFPITIGGMQKHSYYLARNLANKGIKVDLYYIPYDNPTEEKELIDIYFSNLEKTNIEFIPVNWQKTIKFPGHYLIESYNYSRKIFKKLVKRKDYDYIYAKGFSAWHTLKMKRKGYLLPQVGVKFHGYEMFQIAPSFKYSFEKLLLKLPVKWNNKNADQIFSYGGKITSLIENLDISKNKIIEIPTGIENSWLTQNKIHLPQKPVKFVFIGRYERRKGIEELHSVLRQLIKENQKFEFHFIGPIPKSKHLSNQKSTYSNQQQESKKQQLNPQITYHGAIIDQEKIKEILDKSDVLVCPSYSEGMPNVILEGMARGLAIIASDVGAINTQVNSDNGILIEPGNKKQIKQAIEKIIQMDNEQLLEMKRNSIQKIKEKFLWENVADKTIEAIRQIRRVGD